MAIMIFRVMFLTVLCLKYTIQECADIPTIFISESFILPDSPTDWYMPMKESPTTEKVMSVIRGKDVQVGEGGSKTVCFSVQLESPVVNGPFKIECSFEYISQLTCEMTQEYVSDVSSVLMRPLIPKYVEAQYIKTDGSTYALVTLCFGGHTTFWFAVSNVPTLPDPIQNEILDFLESFGLDTSTEGGLNYSILDPAVAKGGC